MTLKTYFKGTNFGDLGGHPRNLSPAKQRILVNRENCSILNRPRNFFFEKRSILRFVFIEILIKQPKWLQSQPIEIN